MRKITFSSLWAAFVIFVFLNIIFSSLLVIFIIYVIAYLGIAHDIKSPKALSTLFGVLLFSVMIASTISYFIGKHVFKPINNISQAMRNVSKGDFSVRLNYDGTVKELENMSDNFNAMVHELGNMEALRNDFVVTVSHEFKTPLAAIEGYGTILRNPALTIDEYQECLQKISESIKQLAQLSSSILMISNLENKEMITEKKYFRLDEQIRHAVLLLEPLWERKNLTLNIDLDHVTYYSNEELLMQVWINLINNAIKFTPKNGEINLLLKRTTQGIEITVSDTGVGIPQEIQKNIFDKFYKADRSGNTDGNGLGLALVKRIVDLSHGKIIVQSEPDAGSNFTVILPDSK
ncbi:MAG: two-component sensor histidine kinase [Bacillota bacterium]|nr:two-component sensor histidine kinase [Bacillota bacterium]